MYSDLVKVLTDHFSLKLSEIVQCSKFCDCSRKRNESISAFVAELHLITEHCNFVSALTMIQDRIMCVALYIMMQFRRDS